MDIWLILVYGHLCALLGGFGGYWAGIHRP